MILCWLLLHFCASRLFTRLVYVKVTEICFSLHPDRIWCVCVFHRPPHLFCSYSCFSSWLSKLKNCVLFTQPAHFFLHTGFLCEGSHVVYDGRSQFVSSPSSSSFCPLLVCSTIQAEREMVVILLLLLLARTKKNPNASSLRRPSL